MVPHQKSEVGRNEAFDRKDFRERNLERSSGGCSGGVAAVAEVVEALGGAEAGNDPA